MLSDGLFKVEFKDMDCALVTRHCDPVRVSVECDAVNCGAVLHLTQWWDINNNTKKNLVFTAPLRNSCNAEPVAVSHTLIKVPVKK